MDKRTFSYIQNCMNLLYLKHYETFFTLTEEDQQFVAEIATKTIYSCEQVAKCYLDNNKDKNKTKMEVLKYNVKLLN